MEHLELVLFGFLAVTAALVVLASAVGIPYPILLVVGGLALGLVPGAPRVELDPELVLIIFLPPLLYVAAFLSSLRDLRANLVPIVSLATGLVVVTAAVVAVVAHEAIGLPWAAAFALGAILSPTDPIAATAIARRLGLPRRIVTVLEGESLINDATALVVYRFAVAAAVTGTFSLVEAPLRFVVNAVGGIVIGLAVGVVVAAVRRRLENAPIEITISLMTAYFAYLPAEALHVSGVLAAVTSGIYLGWRSPELVSPSTRIQATSVWEILIFLLNAALFVLIGLQLPIVLDRLDGTATGGLLLDAALVALAVMGVRLAWLWTVPWLYRRISLAFRGRYVRPTWPAITIVGWTGMRGGVSLAAALALPLQTDAGTPFPGRDEIVFCAFVTILATLLLQGLSLPWLIRRLRVRDDGAEEIEEVEARIRAAEAALERIDELAREHWVRADTAERLRGLYDYRRRRFVARLDGADGDGLEERSRAYGRLRRELLEAERQAVVDLRRQGRISDEVMHRVERDLDLEDARLEL